MKLVLRRTLVCFFAVAVLFSTACSHRILPLSIRRSEAEKVDAFAVTEEMYFGMGSLEPEGFVFSGRVLIVGDSTASEQYSEWRFERQDLMGWGKYLDWYFREETREEGKQGVTVSNMARSGGSSLSFLDTDNYQTMLDSLEKGDYLFIQFGHNDQKTDITEGTSATLSRKDVSEFGTDENGYFSFEWILYEKYIKIALERGAVPVLISSPARVNFETGGALVSGSLPYRDVMQALAEEFSLPFIDLTGVTEAFYKKRVEEEGEDANLYLHSFSDVERTAVDQTHFSRYGAFRIAGLIAEEVEKQEIALSRFVIESRREIRPRAHN